MKRLGVDVDKMIYVQAKTVEEVFDISESIIKDVRSKNNNRILTIIWDSVAATPTKEELELCKQHLINSFPGEFITNQQVLDWISYLSFYKLPMDFFDHYIDNVYSATHGSVLNAWKSRVNVQHMQTVIIG
jgi:predicted Zn-dependent peptidase